MITRGTERERLVHVEPDARRMGRRKRKQCVDERPCARVEREVMRENAGRLEGIAVAFAPRAQMRDQTRQRRIVADETPIATPRDRVDVRVDLRQIRSGLGRGTGAETEIIGRIRSYLAA